MFPWFVKCGKRRLLDECTLLLGTVTFTTRGLSAQISEELRKCVIIPKHFAIIAAGYRSPLVPPTESIAFRIFASSSLLSLMLVASAFSSKYLTRFVLRKLREVSLYVPHIRPEGHTHPGIGRKSSP